MKTLIRATKAIDQEAMSGLTYPSRYIPIDELQRWTGLGVSPELAMNMVTVYQCVRVLSNLFAQLPLILYRRLPGGGKERATEHPWYRTLHLQANPDMSSFAWRRLTMVHLATWGNAYSEITRDALGRPQLWPVRPDRIEPSYEKGLKVYDYLSPAGGRKRLEPGTIFHLTNLSTNGLIGSSPINDLRSTITLARTAERFGESFFGNGARPATVMTHPKTLSNDAISRLAGQMDALRGSGNAGKTVILEEGLDFKEIGIPPEDAQFMETRLFQKRELAGAYGIPPHKIGDLERATFSNIEHQSLELIQDTMMPHLVNTETEAEIQLIDDDGYFPEFLVDGYLRGDAKTRAEALAIRWQHGTLNPDEWRAKENENPISDGSGQRYYTPVNYAATNVEEEPVAEEPTEEPRPALFAVKSMGEFKCPECSKLINRLAAPGTVGYCRGCKAERTMAGKSAEMPNDMVDGMRAVLRSLAEPPVVNVPEALPPVINIPKPDATVVHVHTDSFVEAVDDLKAMLAQPKSWGIERGPNGELIRFVQTPVKE